MINMEFKSKQEEIGSYRKAGFSYYQIAKLLKTSTKTVWVNLEKGESRELTGDEMHELVNKMGLPRGSVRIVKNMFSQLLE